MNRSGLQRIIPIILVLIVVGLVIAALVSVGRTFFGGGSSPSPSASSSTSSSPTTVAVSGKDALTSTLPDRGVRMSVRGPIVADENFHDLTLTITPSTRTLTTYKGYGNTQVDNEQLANTVASYEQFVYALSKANMMEGTPLTGGADDTKGVCATGYIYQFEVLQGDSTVERLWTSTCTGAAGSLKANRPQLTSLFRSQIPNYAVLANKVLLNV